MSHAADSHSIADLDRRTATDSDTSGQYAVSSDPGAADDTHASADNRMCTDSTVVTDLHLVIYFDAVFDDRILDGTAVDGTGRTDADIRADTQAAELRNGNQMTTLVRRKPETIGSQHCTGMNLGSGTKYNAVIKHHIRMQDDPVSQQTVGTDYTVRVNDHTAADLCPGFNDDTRTDRNLGANDCSVGDVGRRIDSRSHLITHRKQGRRPGKRKIRIFHQQRIAVPVSGILRAQQHCTGKTGLQITAIGGIRQVRQLCSGSGFKTAETVDLNCRITNQLRLELIGEFTKRVHAGHRAGADAGQPTRRLLLLVEFFSDFPGDVML